MASTPKPMRAKHTSNSSPGERRTTSSTFSSSTRGYSVDSSETGESSRAASKRESYATLNNDEPNTNPQTTQNVKDGRGSHRSHRSRQSGGFLLSNSTFESPTEKLTRQPKLPHDKGKAPVRSPEKRHIKRRSNVGLGIASSPLAANVTIVGSGNVTEDALADGNVGEDVMEARAPSALDVDSAQMVNLALNLSESRRNAARKSISTALPPLASTFGEGFATGSLRQHLQQQRRVSRNISPKPKKTAATSPRITSAQATGLSHVAYDAHPEGAYQYHFSESTLARAEKAKLQIELMAQYRKLLHYVPPLKPQGLERTNTASSAMSASPSTASGSRAISSSSPQPLGREYNPLQYIRNRKVRARERMAIDGEAQGFADLTKVKSWIDEVSQAALQANPSDQPSLPVFSRAAEVAASPITSPYPTSGKSPSAFTKVKRPRMDWDTSPADMLADLFWLEQDDHKKVIEDHLGRRIFPQNGDLKRPLSRRTEDSQPLASVEQKTTTSSDLRIDTKLPEFKSLKAEEKHDSTASRVRHKIRDATRIHHGSHGSSREPRQFLVARSRSASSSSDSDGGRRSLEQRRSGTTEDQDRSGIILEKQMLEMLAKESGENEWNHPQHDLESIQNRNSGDTSRKGLDAYIHSGSIIAAKDHATGRISQQHTSSGRASLEVPGANPRGSFEEYDTTAPSSPVVQGAKLANTFVPSISMDLTPPPRKGSPSRLSKVRSKINPFDHSRAHSKIRTESAAAETPMGKPLTGEHSHSPEHPEKRPRSTSPMKIALALRKTEEGADLSRRSSLRRGKTDDSSGIRGLFKNNRGPVARVSEFLWKKESPLQGTKSGYTTDEFDDDESVASQRSYSTPIETVEDEMTATKSGYDLPSFTSSFERGRQGKETTDTLIERQAREERRRSSRAHLLETPPRIDIHTASPASSPGFRTVDRFPSDSSVSDNDSRRHSYSKGVLRADARLNDILGLPGHRASNMWPVTGLSGLETNSKRPSMDGKRQWSISDRGISVHRGPMTKREIARVRAVLLSSGVKAREISRRAHQLRELVSPDDTPNVQSVYKGILELAQGTMKPVPKTQQHIVAAGILSDDIQLSKHMWQVSADAFCNSTVQDLLDRIGGLQGRILDGLAPMARKAADEADEVSKDLVTSQTLKVKSITDAMDNMLRKRRRRFRWLRRGGWVVVEWVLVGVMWFVWLVVVFARLFLGIGKTVWISGRWLLWL